MLEYFTYPDGDLWHTVYRQCGGGLISVAAGISERLAEQEAHRLNVEQKQRKAASVAMGLIDPIDRPLPRGMYTDEDAA